MLKNKTENLSLKLEVPGIRVRLEGGNSPRTLFIVHIEDARVNESLCASHPPPPEWACVLGGNEGIDGSSVSSSNP